MTEAQVAVLMGSKSDVQVMQAALQILDQFQVVHEVKVLSAHRTPEETRRYVVEAGERGIQIFIAGAGMAAHLAGAVAAHTPLPVIGVPIDSSPLQGMDALLSTVQMPSGIPVATMSIGKAGAKNAAVFAIQILSLQNPDLRQKLAAFRTKMRQDLLENSTDVAPAANP